MIIAKVVATSPSPFDTEIHVGIMLPSAMDKNCLPPCRDSMNFATMEAVLPIIEIAAQDVRNRFQYRPSGWLSMRPLPIICNNQSLTARTALKAVQEYNITANFGPCCDYAIASAARIMGERWFIYGYKEVLMSENFHPPIKI